MAMVGGAVACSVLVVAMVILVRPGLLWVAFVLGMAAVAGWLSWFACLCALGCEGI